MSRAALLIGILILLQGLFGMIAPDAFFDLISFMQNPPVIFGAAVIRVAFGVVLFGAASASRAAGFLRTLGAIVFVGGMLTPFVGVRFGRAILDSWVEGGPAMLRLWAAGSLVLGALILYAVTPIEKPPNNTLQRRGAA